MGGLLDNGVIKYHIEYAPNAHLFTPKVGTHLLDYCIKKRALEPCEPNERQRYVDCHAGGWPLFCFACEYTRHGESCTLYRSVERKVEKRVLLMIHSVKKAGAYRILEADIVWEGDDDGNRS